MSMFEDGYMAYDYQDNITRQDFCVALTQAIDFYMYMMRFYAYLSLIRENMLISYAAHSII